MKKFLFVPVLALAAVSLSCSKDNIAGEGGENASGSNEVIVFSEPQIEIGAVSAGTKTTLENSSIKWEEVEYISLFNADGSNTWTYELTAGAGTTSATFTAQGEPQTGFTYAIYPQNSNVPSGAAIAANLATGQTYSEDGFPTLYPMAAETTDGKNFEFKNLATILRLPLTGNATIASIKIESVGEESLAGAATIDLKGETPVLTAAGGASASVTLDCTKSYPVLDESEPTYFNFILFPGTYSKGFKFTITETNGNVTSVSTAETEITLTAGTFKNFNTPLKIATPQGWNIFGTIAGEKGFIEMTGGHGVQYCGNVTATEEQNTFRIRYANDETQTWGSYEENYQLQPLAPYGLLNGGSQFTVAPGTYDFYFIENKRELIVCNAGESAFSVIGQFNNGIDYPMTFNGEYLVANGIEINEEGQGWLKIRTTGTWDHYNIGYQYQGDFYESSIGQALTVYNPGNDIMMRTTGTFDLYLDLNGIDRGTGTLYIMNAGDRPE